jgi:hypothetical protein
MRTDGQMDSAILIGVPWDCERELTAFTVAM